MRFGFCSKIPVCTTLAAGILSAACGDSREAARTQVPVVIAAPAGQAFANDLGWRVTVDSFRVSITNVVFTTDGETHAHWIDRVTRWLLPKAHAHPGHLAGGEPIGELPGAFVIDWIQESGRVLGQASMIVGHYDGMDFSFTPAVGLPDGDPLSGHTAFIAGTATREERTVTFTAVLDVDSGAGVFGVPFNADLMAGDGRRVALGLVLFEPSTMQNLFRLIDFEALDLDEDDQIAIAPGSGAHNILRRHLQSHIHYQAALAMP